MESFWKRTANGEQGLRAPLGKGGQGPRVWGQDWEGRAGWLYLDAANL